MWRKFDPDKYSFPHHHRTAKGERLTLFRLHLDQNPFKSRYRNRSRTERIVHASPLLKFGLDHYPEVGDLEWVRRNSNPTWPAGIFFLSFFTTKPGQEFYGDWSAAHYDETSFKTEPVALRYGHLKNHADDGFGNLVLNPFDLYETHVTSDQLLETLILRRTGQCYEYTIVPEFFAAYPELIPCATVNPVAVLSIAQNPLSPPESKNYNTMATGANSPKGKYKMRHEFVEMALKPDGRLLIGVADKKADRLIFYKLQSAKNVVEADVTEIFGEAEAEHEQLVKALKYGFKVKDHFENKTPPLETLLVGVNPENDEAAFLTPDGHLERIKIRSYTTGDLESCQAKAHKKAAAAITIKRRCAGQQNNRELLGLLASGARHPVGSLTVEQGRFRL